MYWYNLITFSMMIGAVLSTSAEAATVQREARDTSGLSSKTEIQTASQPPIREAQVRQAPPAAPATPAAPSQPQRVETTTYDSWAVTCQEVAGKKTCGAVLRAANPGGREPLLIWEIGTNEQGRPITIVRVPTGLAIEKDKQQVGGGILIQNGIELKFGSGQARRLGYTSCNPRRCIAEAAIDDAFVKEALANTTATVTAYALGGHAVPLEISIKGIDKAISLTRK